jgi:hypothetical protein
MNLYGFAFGDPVNFSDPMGLSPCCLNAVSHAVLTPRVSDAAGMAAIKARWPEIEGMYNEGVRDIGSLMAIGAGLEGLMSGGGAGMSAVGVGDDVGRVYGGRARQMGHSWAKGDPSAVAGYAAKAGLPSANTMTHVVRGVLADATGVKVTRAAPGARGPGGILEVVIPDPKNQVIVTSVKPYNPKE